MAEPNPFDVAQKQLDDAARIMKLDPDMHAILREPERIIKDKRLLRQAFVYRNGIYG